MKDPCDGVSVINMNAKSKRVNCWRLHARLPQRKKEKKRKESERDKQRYVGCSAENEWNL
jgi:hypothetical protein